MNFEIPPHSLDAEQAVLRSICYKPEMAEPVQQILTSGAGEFYRERNSWLYEDIIWLIQQDTPPDIVTLQDRLNQRGRLEDIGGAKFLREVLSGSPTMEKNGFRPENAIHHARIVHETYLRRRIIGAASRVHALAVADGDPRIVLDDLHVVTHQLELLEQEILGKRKITPNSSWPRLRRRY